MKALIVDDELLCRAELRRLLVANAIDVAGEAANVGDALELTRRLGPDVVFLDVQMRGETGFDFLERVGHSASRVVLVTAHEEFAVRGFECNVLDYLLKPVRPERLAEALRRCRADIAAHSAVDAPAGFTLIRGAAAARLVPWGDIGCVVAEGNYTRVTLREGNPCLVLRPLKDWLELAPAGCLMQVHRANLVRLDWMRELRATVHGDREIVLVNGDVVPVGRAYWPGLRARFEAVSPVSRV